MILIDTSSCYHNLKLYKNHIIFNHISLQPFGAVPAGDMFQQNIDKIFKYLSNVFVTADGILIIGYNENSHDHDTVVRQVMQICRRKNLKSNKYKCYFGCMRYVFFGEITSIHGVELDPLKLDMLTEMPT